MIQDAPRNGPGDAPKFLPIEVDLGLLLLKMDKMKMRIEHQIKDWDRTGDGTISKGEFRRAIRAFGFMAHDEELDAVFASFDADGSNEISYRELNDILRKRAGLPPMTTPRSPLPATGPSGTTRHGAHFGVAFH